ADYARVLQSLPQDRVRWSRWSNLCGEVAKNEELFDRLTALRPEVDSLWFARGRWFATAKKWDEAAAAFARVIEKVPLPIRDRPYDEAFEHPCLRLLADDPAGYREYCRTLAERAGDSPDPYLAFMVARACACGPKPPVESTRAVAWARLAVKTWPNDAWQL